MRNHLFFTSWLQAFTIIAVSASAVAAGILFASAPDEKQFARVEFAKASVVTEIASTPDARKKGLSHRSVMPEFNGILFVFDKPDYVDVWMREMQFPIDILWITNGIVVDIEEHAPIPADGTSDTNIPVYHPDVKADFVLEVNAGFSQDHEIRIGDRVRISMNGKTYADEGLAPEPAGEKYTIDALRKQAFQGGDFRIRETIETNKAYTKYAISYRSGNATISGVMNVPAGNPPQTGFPILILNHGLIPPSEYTTGRGSKREQDFFSRHGYVTIHPDYRGHASSSPDTAMHHDFYVGYTEDVTSLLDAIKRDPPSFMDTSRIGMWGHSMGGGMATRVMVLRPEVKAFVLFAPISADAQDNFYELPLQEIQWLYDTYGPTGNSLYQRISPLTYFSDVSVPVQIHVGTADTAVPPSFSEKIYKTLQEQGKQAEFFMYPGEKHEFINDWPLAANRALQFFDHYVKNQ